MHTKKFRGFLHSEAYDETICLDGKIIQGKWVEGSLIKGINCFYIAPFPESYNDYSWTDGFYLSIDVEEVIPETIEQLTGLVDKNNHNIWEHCECTVASITGGTLAYGYIKLIQGCFVFVEYGTHNVMRLCDLETNNLVIKITNDFYDTTKVEKDGAK